MPRCTLGLTYVEHIIWYIFKKTMNRKEHLQHVVAILSMLRYPLVSQMHLLMFSIKYKLEMNELHPL